MLSSISNTLVLMTFNIHSGKDLNDQNRFNDLIQLIKNTSPDILAIQEINENNVRGNHITQLVNELDYNLHFGPNIKLYDGFYGIVTLSKLPILKKQHIFLPSLSEQRGLIHTTLEFHGRRINVFNTHLGLNTLERALQFRIINKHIELHSKNSGYSILLGDLNTDKPNYNKSLLIDTSLIKSNNHPTLIG